eukprot:UC1_evm1s2063
MSTAPSSDGNGKSLSSKMAEAVVTVEEVTVGADSPTHSSSRSNIVSSGGSSSSGSSSSGSNSSSSDSSSNTCVSGSPGLFASLSNLFWSPKKQQQQEEEGTLLSPTIASPASTASFISSSSPLETTPTALLTTTTTLTPLVGARVESGGTRIYLEGGGGGGEGEGLTSSSSSSSVSGGGIGSFITSSPRGSPAAREQRKRKKNPSRPTRLARGCGETTVTTTTTTRSNDEKHHISKEMEKKKEDQEARAGEQEESEEEEGGERKRSRSLSSSLLKSILTPVYTLFSRGELGSTAAVEPEDNNDMTTPVAITATAIADGVVASAEIGGGRVAAAAAAAAAVVVVAKDVEEREDEHKKKKAEELSKEVMEEKAIDEEKKKKKEEEEKEEEEEEKESIEEKEQDAISTPAVNASVEAEEEYEDESEGEADELIALTLDPYEFIRNVPPLPLAFAERSPALPKRTRYTHPMTLVLDLDETLVHCSVEELSSYSLKFPVDFNGQTFTVFARVRPHMHAFLREVSKHYEVILFTASQRLYADTLLDLLDPGRQMVKHRLFREHCALVQGCYVKDLGILGRDLRKTLIVDNSPQAFAYQTSNGIPILSWFENPRDEELLNLIPFLRDLARRNPDDVRPIVRERFRFHEINQIPVREY